MKIEAMPLCLVPNNTNVVLDLGKMGYEKFLFKKMDGLFGICQSEQYGEQYIKANTIVLVRVSDENR